MRPILGPNRQEKERFGLGLTVPGDPVNDGNEDTVELAPLSWARKQKERECQQVSVCQLVKFCKLDINLDLSEKMES